MAANKEFVLVLYPLSEVSQGMKKCVFEQICTREGSRFEASGSERYWQGGASPVRLHDMCDGTPYN